MGMMTSLPLPARQAGVCVGHFLCESIGLVLGSHQSPKPGGRGKSTLRSVQGGQKGCLLGL